MKHSKIAIWRERGSSKVPKLRFGVRGVIQKHPKSDLETFCFYRSWSGESSNPTEKIENIRKAPIFDICLCGCGVLLAVLLCFVGGFEFDPTEKPEMRFPVFLWGQMLK